MTRLTVYDCCCCGKDHPDLYARPLADGRHEIRCPTTGALILRIGPATPAAQAPAPTSTADRPGGLRKPPWLVEK